MTKGDLVRIISSHKIGVVEKVEDGFIFVNGRPYMRPQLELYHIVKNDKIKVDNK